MIGDPRAKDVACTGIMDSGYARKLSSMDTQEFINKKEVRAASIDDPG